MHKYVVWKCRFVDVCLHRLRGVGLAGRWALLRFRCQCLVAVSDGALI